MTEKGRKVRFAVFTEQVGDDAGGARLAERVEECVNDHDGARVQWRQTATEGFTRLTAIISWLE